jgi:hypothetical protein
MIPHPYHHLQCPLTMHLRIKSVRFPGIFESKQRKSLPCSADISPPIHKMLVRVIVFAATVALASAVSNSKIYEDPPKSLAQLSDEFKTLITPPVTPYSPSFAAPQARSLALSRPDVKSQPVHRSNAGRSATSAVCLTPPCETEDIMVRAPARIARAFSRVRAEAALTAESFAVQGEPLVSLPRDAYHLDRIGRTPAPCSSLHCAALAPAAPFNANFRPHQRRHCARCAAHEPPRGIRTIAGAGDGSRSYRETRQRCEICVGDGGRLDAAEAARDGAAPSGHREEAGYGERPRCSSASSLPPAPACSRARGHASDAEVAARQRAAGGTSNV